MSDYFAELVAAFQTSDKKKIQDVIKRAEKEVKMSSWDGCFQVEDLNRFGVLDDIVRKVERDPIFNLPKTTSGEEDEDVEILRQQLYECEALLAYERIYLLFRDNINTLDGGDDDDDDDDKKGIELCDFKRLALPQDPELDSMIAMLNKATGNAYTDSRGVDFSRLQQNLQITWKMVQMVKEQWIQETGFDQHTIDEILEATGVIVYKEGDSVGSATNPTVKAVRQRVMNHCELVQGVYVGRSKLARALLTDPSVLLPNNPPDYLLELMPELRTVWPQCRDVRRQLHQDGESLQRIIAKAIKKPVVSVIFFSSVNRAGREKDIQQGSKMTAPLVLQGKHNLKVVAEKCSKLDRLLREFRQVSSGSKPQPAASTKRKQPPL